MSSRRTSTLLASALLLAAPGRLLAQTAAPAPAPHRESPIELSPFLVQTDRDTGYLAANTLVVRYSWETGGPRAFRAVPQPPTEWRLTANIEL